MKLAVTGGTGFVGRAVVAEAHRRQGVDVATVAAPRIGCPPGTPPAVSAGVWIESNPAGFDALVETLGGVDVLVNAAGMAAPNSAATAELYGANAVLPAVLAVAAARAGVRRLVHISSAAVQGRMDPLNETTAVQPLTPYGDSKAQGEAVLSDPQLESPAEVVIYRPTSVQGVDRRMTHQLARVARLPAFPSYRRGDIPVPVALIENVAAGIVHAALATECAPVVLHPWEGMTVRRLFATLGPTRVLPVPRIVLKAGLGSLAAVGRFLPSAAAVARRVELLAFGQSQDARALSKLGFSLPTDADGYADLATSLRSPARR